MKWQEQVREAPNMDRTVPSIQSTELRQSQWSDPGHRIEAQCNGQLGCCWDLLTGYFCYGYLGHIQLQPISLTIQTPYCMCLHYEEGT